MPTTVKQGNAVKTATVQATEQIKQMLHVDDLKILSAAVALATAAEIAKNGHFKDIVLHEYQQLAASSTPVPSRTPHKEVRLVPIGNIEGMDYSPLGPLDPYILLKLYGRDQFYQALENNSFERLKVVARNLMEKYPGTKPKSLGNRTSVIEYIFKMVTGE